jgi:hypothetical protein
MLPTRKHSNPERAIFSESHVLRVYPFVFLGCVWSSGIPRVKFPPEASKYGSFKPQFPHAEVLIYLQLIKGRVCAVEGILERQPELRVLRDPPSLAGQRIRCVMAFHFDPENATVARCKVRAQAWTDPSLHSRFPVDKETSMMLAKSIFDVAKEDFEESDPDVIRARGIRAALRHLL